MAIKKLPEFIVYQQSRKEFHICFRVNDRFIRWCSYYAPALDPRFPREMTRIKDIAVKKLPAKPVFDKGSYTVSRTDNREEAMQKMLAGAGEKSFAFILEGKKLKGRFLLKNNSRNTLLQKYKDKYATEEDVLATDLTRTVQTMLPDYDPRKIKLPQHKKTSRAAVQEQELQELPPETITADKKIGSSMYHFKFYTSDDDSVICIAASSKGVVALQLSGRKWRVMTAAKRPAAQEEQAFAAHAAALYAGQK